MCRRPLQQRPHRPILTVWRNLRASTSMGSPIHLPTPAQVVSQALPKAARQPSPIAVARTKSLSRFRANSPVRFRPQIASATASPLSRPAMRNRSRATVLARAIASLLPATSFQPTRSIRLPSKVSTPTAAVASSFKWNVWLLSKPSISL